VVKIWKTFIAFPGIINMKLELVNSLDSELMTIRMRLVMKGGDMGEVWNSEEWY
jgi:hypothetical protein